jgi:hypothetical protein
MASAILQKMFVKRDKIKNETFIAKVLQNEKLCLFLLQV